MVQCFQLGMMTGTDVADPLQQIRVQPSADDASVLELTPEYDASFKAMLDKLAARADELIAASAPREDQAPKGASSLIFAQGA